MSCCGAGLRTGSRADGRPRRSNLDDAGGRRLLRCGQRSLELIFRHVGELLPHCRLMLGVAEARGVCGPVAPVDRGSHDVYWLRPWSPAPRLGGRGSGRPTRTFRRKLCEVAHTAAAVGAQSWGAVLLCYLDMGGRAPLYVRRLSTEAIRPHLGTGSV